ncbi:polyprenyl synthetase family protein [Streptomyces sp. cg36]|uniref:polyprenyl synthetase family protein n=1 Tax=Streptomyces sp. cg36 TaxID=3238798 RepID=UPI0034E25709
MTHLPPDTTGLLHSSPEADGEETLRRGTALVDPLLREAVGRLHPSMATVCRYHLGWDTPAASALPVRTGKRVRAALALLSVRSVGAPEQLAGIAGTAVELVHQLSLLHDDIMDGDAERRGQAAAWARFGTGAAVLAGDALIVQAVRTVVRAQAPGAQAATEDLVVTVEAMVDGQAEDLALEQADLREISADRYMSMAGGKTGALFGCAAALGAVLCQAPEPTVRALRSAGRDLGTAFQILDDVLGLWGDPALTGKPVGGDLRRGKKTLPLILAARSDTTAGRQLAALVNRSPLPAHRLQDVMRLLADTGAREYAEAIAARHMASALTALDEAEVAEDVRTQWHALIGCLSGRSS